MMEVDEITIRPGIREDLIELQLLYTDTIKTVCKKDYTDEQIQAWISGIKNKQRWIDILDRQYVVVAQDNSRIAGFATLDNGEYIDMFYVNKDYVGLGIGNKLYNEIELEAQRLTKPKIFSHVSKTARPFFEKKGFKVLHERTVIIEALELTNFRMEKELSK